MTTNDRYIEKRIAREILNIFILYVKSKEC